MALKYLLAALVAVSAVNPAATLASALYPSSSSSPEPQLSLQIQILQEVVASILAGRTIVLYFDRAITPQSLRQITTLFILQDCSLVLVDLGSDGEEWCHKQSLVVLRGENIIHVAVFINDPRPFFMSVNTDTRWKPKYFLMFSLSSNLRSEILISHEFSRPEKLVMFNQKKKRKSGSSGPMEMFTYFPFSVKDEVASLGVWSLAAHQSHNVFVDRFPTFEGYRFLLGTWFYDFPYLHQAKNKPEGEGDGVQVEVLNALATKLNYTFDLTTEPPDEKWGSFENGSWNGMLGMVYREEKNFTVNYFGYTNKRIEDFDATVSYWMEGFGLALLEPQPLPKWRSVYYPFTTLVWASTAFAFSVVTIAFYLQDIAQTKPTLKNGGLVWLYVLRPMLSHALPQLPETHSQRVFVAAWWLTSLILTTAYTANLIAFLTIPLYPKKLQTVEELAESNYRLSSDPILRKTLTTLIWVVIMGMGTTGPLLQTLIAMLDYGEFVPQALKSSQDKYYRMLGEKMDMYADDDESVYPTLNGTHAYIESYSYNLILFWDTYQARNIYMLRDQLYPGHLCWYFRKNTPWKYKFDVGLQSIVEAGLIVRWLKIKTEDFLGVDFESKLHSDGGMNSTLALSLSHTQGVFFLLILGWSFSMAVFWGEVVRMGKKNGEGNTRQET